MMLGLILMILGCSTSQSAEQTLNEQQKRQITPEEQACTQDSECILAPKECCSCNMGGAQSAINSQKQAQLNDRRKSACASVFCAAVLSTDATCKSTAKALCQNKTCQVSVP